MRRSYVKTIKSNSKMMKNTSLICISLLLINVLGSTGVLQNCGKKEEQVYFNFISRSMPHGRIIFQSLRDAPLGNPNSIKKYWELYSMDVDGSNVTRITRNLYWEHQPDISPDGNKIVFAIHYNPSIDTKETDSGWEIAVMDIDGTNLTRLTSNDKLDACPHWNHDGTKIVYVSDTYGNFSCFDIYIMDPNGENVTKLTNAGIGEFYADPSFSFSDGKSKILYIHSKGYTSNWDIYMMNEDGSDQHLILSTNNKYLAYHDPMFSPDDSAIVFSAKLNENGNHGIPIYKIFTARVDGSNIRQITDNDDESDVVPQYSPDGGKIVYFTWKWNGVVFERKIRIINIEGTNERIISSFSPEEMPSWYPRYIRIEKPVEKHLYIADREIIRLLKNTVIIGKITIKADAYDENGVEKVEFYIDDELKNTDYIMPYSWLWDEFAFGMHEIKVIAYDNEGNADTDEMEVAIFNF
ncbi:MAG TPA: hypothetical protein ENI33_03780 [Thermoplasmatales archaeon]|nr:hypothetical protein [Thermoplasmatales archaeon]